MRYLILLASLLFAISASAEDWTFFRGPNYDGSTSERLASTQLDSSKIVWRKELGKGSASFTVKGDRVYTMSNKDGRDIVYCFDAKSGEEAWMSGWPCKFEARMWEGGTAATPTLDQDHVYAFSYDGQLHCLKQSDGSKVWSKHMVKDYGGKLSRWKYAGSPTIIGSALLLDIGGGKNSTVALKKKDGALIWGSGNGNAGYAPVMPFKHAEGLTLLAFKGKAMVGLEARTGREQFSIPWESSYDVNASSPIVVGDGFLVSSGYPKTGRAAFYKMSGGKPSKVWQNDDVKTKMSSVARAGSHFYAASEKRGQIMCLDGKSGKTLWSTKGSGQYGNVIVAADKLIVLSDTGVLRIADASPSGWKQHSELDILDGRCWVQPTFANGQIYSRNNNGTMVVVRP